MSDISITFQDGCFVLDKDGNGYISIDDGLQTAVILSLFSDKRVPDSELPPGVTFKRGWWGDMFPVVDNDQWGSKLWLFGRGKLTPETIVQIEAECLSALNWMVLDGIAAKVNAEAVKVGLDQVKITTQIIRPQGGDETFAFLWDAQGVNLL